MECEECGESVPNEEWVITDYTGQSVFCCSVQTALQFVAIAKRLQTVHRIVNFVRRATLRLKICSGHVQRSLDCSARSYEDA